MRLLELEFTALGPYPNRQFIDFTDFEANGLYLLRGKTGSGKSTIIDAITYALYGNVAGGSDSTSLRLRSHFASASTRTTVRLRFQTWGRLYEVTRSPAYNRAGFKTKTVASATLTRLEPSADGESGGFIRHTQATGLTAVTQAVEELTGINFAQFCQTVILPQGKFAHFLAASPDQRRQILASIFHTSQYERFIEELKLRADTKQASLREEITRVVERSSTLGERTHELAKLSQWDEALRSALDFAQDLDDRARAAIRSAEEAQWDYLETRRATEEAVAIERKNLAYQRVSEHLRELSAQREEFDGIHRQLELAQAADPVLVMHEAFTKASRVLLQAQRQSELACSEVQRVGLDVSPEQLSAKRDEITLQIHRIGEALEAQTRSKVLQSERDQYQLQIRQAQEKIEVSQDKIAGAQLALPIFERNLEQLSQAVGELSRLKHEREGVCERLEYVAQADELRERLVECAEKIGLARRNQRQAEEAFVSVRQQWVSSSASRLAQQLEANCPCPVCGSAVHPHPAGQADEVVGDDLLQAAQRAYEQADRELNKLLNDQSKLTDKISSLNALAGGDKHSLHVRLEELDNTIEFRHSQASQLEAGRKDLVLARQELVELQDKLAQLNVDVTGWRERERSVGEQIEKLRVIIEAATGGFDSITQRHQHLCSQLELIDTWSEAQDALRNAVERLDVAADQVRRTLLDSPFEDVTEAEAAHLPTVQRNHLHERRQTWLSELSGAKALQAELVNSGLVGRVHPELTLMKGRVRKLNVRAAELSRSATELSLRRDEAASAVRRFAESIEVLQAAQSQLAPLRQLALLARGATAGEGERIRLDTWILITQFRDVVAAANPYLDRFSSGRYQLRRVDRDPGAVKAQAGLGLAIADGQTDELRSPSSLSGGEVFYTSLALALGLVEVISSYRGGIEFKSMIIDEGFGHLDSVTLDDVMTGLEQLRDSGRTVGVVSHVAQMRERIRDGIEVNRNEDGHSSLVVIAG